MHALPLAISLLVTVALARPVLRMLVEAGNVRPNYRGRRLPVPFGVLVPLAALLALIPALLVQRLGDTGVLYPEFVPVLAYAVGIALLGLIDDVLQPRGAAAEAPRGLRGHARAAVSGRLSTGALKGLGSLGLALLAAGALQRGNARWLLAAAVLVLATHAFNLLDLRPGRSFKAAVLLGAGLALGSQEVRPLWVLGAFAGPAVVAGLYDLRERTMLGDTGASLLGALAGLWLVLTLSGPGQLVALGLLAVIAAYAELRSLSDLIERTPGLRQLDSLGRPA